MRHETVAIPESLRSYVEDSLARLAYLYPDLELGFDTSRCQITARSKTEEAVDEDLHREVLYQLYREKVFRDTLPIRKRLYGDI